MEKKKLKNFKKEKLFLSKYLNRISKLISQSQNQITKILEVYKILIKLNPKNKIHIFGNGGSASIASHFSMDLTNNTDLKCYNYNDPSMITCFANDFGFENWIKRAIQKYGEKKNILILISSSGKSKNMLNAVKSAKKKKFSKVITLTGFNENNPLRKIGDINIFVNSKDYNHVENLHQIMLLTLVDMIKNFKTRL